MGKVERFTDLIAWQLARRLTREVYAITSSGGFAKDFGLRDQIRRASVSIMSNIAEGFDRGGRPEFAQFLSISKGSTAEVKSLLFVAFDAGYIDEPKMDELHALVEEVQRVVAGLRNAVAKQRDADKPKS